MAKKEIGRPSTAHIPPFGLRLQPELKERIEWASKENSRSMNAEIAARLQESLDGGSLTIPDGIREALNTTAQANGWPFESEMLHRLVDSLQDQPEIDRLRLLLEKERKESAALREELEAELADKRKHSTMLYVLLDANGHPISWPEIHAYVASIRRAVGFNPREMNISVITPGVESDSTQSADEAAAARIYREFGKSHLTMFAYDDEGPPESKVVPKAKKTTRKPKP